MAVELVYAAVDWVVAALAGRVEPGEFADRLSERLTARGDLAAVLARDERLSVFREHTARIERVETLDTWTACAVLETGSGWWEVRVALESAPPHRIREFRPRPLAADAVAWDAVAPALRELDRVESQLPGPSAARIHRLLSEAVDRGCIVGAAAALAVRGEVVHRELLGACDLVTLAPLSEQAVFRVGSVTKVVTALAVTELAERGLIDLDAPIDRHLPAPVLVPAAPGDPSPTVGQALLHQAGLTKDVLLDRTRMRHGTPLAEAAPRIRLAWAPGARAEYSNLGYQLLGEIIQSVTGEPFTEYCTRTVLARHGLTGTTLQPPGEPLRRTVTGYHASAGRLSPASAAPTHLPAAGGMTSTLPDMLTLATALGAADDPIVASALTRTAPAGPAGRRFGPGVALLDLPAGTVITRGGATEGFTAELVTSTDHSFSLALLTSKSPPDRLDALALRLAEELSTHR
ncbi:serine hydrolase domain-containing protein [Streptacidiphilus melanogenes]|uniref:serine hydrolase domain-containing protein n=1 Tax=Streptacidiphilus melanogenes TaxID=411235 RepID=UPI0005A6FB46|nr:serine hydrolase domain-containing protein [Streptacidiphilus melanogenes]